MAASQTELEMSPPAQELAFAAALARRLDYIDSAELARAQAKAQRAAAEEARARAVGELPALWHDPTAFAHAIPELQAQEDCAMLAAGLSFHLARAKLREDPAEAGLEVLAALVAGAANVNNNVPAFRAGAVMATLAARDKNGSERELSMDVGAPGTIAALTAALNAFDADPAIVARRLSIEMPKQAQLVTPRRTSGAKVLGARSALTSGLKKSTPHSERAREIERETLLVEIERERGGGRRERLD